MAAVADLVADDGWLRCPGCRVSFRVCTVVGEDHGSLACDCRRVPVVAGIPMLGEGEPTRGVLRAIDAGCADEALGRALALPPVKTPLERAGRWVLRVAPLGWRQRSESRRAAAIGRAAAAQQTLRSLLAMLFLDAKRGERERFDRFYHRCSDPIFLATRAMLAPLIAGEGPVLDLTCGVGHLTAELARRIGNDRVVGLDARFSLLYVTRRFLGADLRLVCASADAPLPFDEGAFEGVLSCDAFDATEEPAACAAELDRVTGSDGTIVWSHLAHARAAAGSRRLGESLPGLLPGWSTWLADETEVLDAALAGAALDLSRSTASERLSGARDLVLVAARRADRLRAYAPLALRRPASPRFSPLVAWTRLDSGLRVERRLPSFAYGWACPALERTLPERLTLPLDALRRCAEADPGAESWLRRGIVVDLPPNYE